MKPEKISRRIAAKITNPLLFKAICNIFLYPFSTFSIMMSNFRGFVRIFGPESLSKSFKRYGTITTATKKEAKIAMMIVSDAACKIFPINPESIAIGIKHTIVVAALARIEAETSSQPLKIA